MILTHRVSGGDYEGMTDGDGWRSGRLNAEAGYGFPIADGRFIGSPYVGFGLSGGAREHRLGYRLTLARGDAVTFGMRLHLTNRRNAGAGARAERAIMLGGDVSW